MDLSTMTGLALGLAILAAALFLGHVPPETLLNPEAILIVFGGTLAATLVSFNRDTLFRSVAAIRNLSREQGTNLQETVHYVMDVVGFVRDEGILALQPIIDSVEIPFFRKGLTLVLDNRSEKFIRESLTTEIEALYREQSDYARVFETAGGYAPTMGIIGAVIGLIYTVQAFNNPADLGHGVASAFSATLYGVALSNLFLLPLAARLRQQARTEWYTRTLLLEAILSIRSGEHPLLIEERLNAFTSGTAPTETPTPYKSYGSSPHAGQVIQEPDLDAFMPANSGFLP